MFDNYYTTGAIDTMFANMLANMVAPTISYTPIGNQFYVGTVPTHIDFTLFDTGGVTTLTLQNWATGTNVVGEIAGWVYTLTLSTGLGLHEYVLTAWDNLGNTKSVTITYNVDSDPLEAIDPLVTYITGVMTQTGAAITFTSSETWYAGIQYGVNTEYGNETIYSTILPDIEKTITLAWLTCGTTYHYIVRVQDLAGNRWYTGDLTFDTLSCSDTTAPTVIYGSTYPTAGLNNVSVSINPTVTFSEAMTTSTITGTNIYLKKYTDNSIVSATVSYNASTKTATITPVSDLAYGRQYYIVVTTGAQDASNNAIAHEYRSVFTTQTSSSLTGIIVNSITRILNDNDPAVWWSYISGYHFRFDITVNNSGKDTFKFKLADWSNTTTNTMLVADNTKIVVSEVGVELDTDWTVWTTTTLTAASTYSTGLDISGMDNSDDWGDQITLDLFYKIPTWSQGIYSTSYGIQVTQ